MLFFITLLGTAIALRRQPGSTPAVSFDGTCKSSTLCCRKLYPEIAGLTTEDEDNGVHLVLESSNAGPSRAKLVNTATFGCLDTRWHLPPGDVQWSGLFKMSCPPGTHLRFTVNYNNFDGGSSKLAGCHAISHHITVEIPPGETMSVTLGGSPDQLRTKEYSGVQVWVTTYDSLYLVEVDRLTIQVADKYPTGYPRQSSYHLNVAGERLDQRYTAKAGSPDSERTLLLHIAYIDLRMPE